MSAMRHPHSFRFHHAAELLELFEESSLPLDRCASNYFRANSAIGSKDRKEIAELVYNTTRWRGLLDALTKSTSWAERVSFYQTINPLDYVSRADLPLHIRCSFPKLLFDHLVSHFGEERAFTLCLDCNTAAPVVIRTNPLKTTREALLYRLPPEMKPRPSPNSPYAIFLEGRPQLLSLPAYQEGHFELQDEGSQLVAGCITPLPGERVLDMCAGAGGKSLAFAHHMEGRGQLYLHDVRAHALQESRRRLRRAGIENAQFLLPGHVQLGLLKKKMDWVVVDVPCSGSGTWRRNPDMKWRFNLADLEEKVALQREIVREAVKYLRPGGRLVYATCSLFPEENEQQVAHFTETYGLKLTKEPFSSWPVKDGMDGLFAATLSDPR